MGHTLKTLVGIFWHPEERRLRMMWRIIVQAIVFMILWLILLAVGVQVYALVAVSVGATLSGPEVAAALEESPIALGILSIVTLFAMTLVLFLSAKLLDRRRFADYGLQLNGAWWRDLGFGLFLGAFLMAVIFSIELVFGWVTIEDTFFTSSGEPFLQAFIWPLLLFLGVGIYEEMFSRGYQLLNLAEGISNGLNKTAAVVIATVISSGVFALLHASNPNASVLSTFNIFLAGGTLLAAGFLLTRSLAIPIGVHITWNLFQGNVFGFPVSGGDFQSATVLLIEQGGPDLITGGAFGPEAGLLGIFGMLLGTALTVWYVNVMYGQIRLAPELTNYHEAHANGNKTDDKLNSGDFTNS